MFLLDTNVVSELRKIKSGRANPNVAAWARDEPSARMWLSAITLLELDIGILRLELRDRVQGDLLRKWLDLRVIPSFDGRVLPVDTTVARRCARMHVPDPKPDRDSLIAATALIHGLIVVTRNTSDFVDLGSEMLNPWLGRA